MLHLKNNGNFYRIREEMRQGYDTKEVSYILIVRNNFKAVMS